MSRIPSRLVPFLLVGSAALANVGCTDYSTSVFIRQVQQRKADNECVVDNDPSSTALFSGTLDLAYPNASNYFAAVLVGNQLIRRGSEAQLKPEANRVQFYEADVELIGGSSPGTQTVSGFADPASGDEPGYGIVGISLITGAVEGAYVARVIVRGVTIGGEDVETGYWDFPILVCNGCLGCIRDTCDADVLVSCDSGQQPADCRLIDPTACDAP